MYNTQPPSSSPPSAHGLPGFPNRDTGGARDNVLEGGMKFAGFSLMQWPGHRTPTDVFHNELASETTFASQRRLLDEVAPAFA